MIWFFSFTTMGMALTLFLLFTRQLMTLRSLRLRDWLSGMALLAFCAALLRG
jgi:hypothetical protein